MTTARGRTHQKADRVGDVAEGVLEDVLHDRNIDDAEEELVRRERLTTVAAVVLLVLVELATRRVRRDEGTVEVGLAARLRNLVGQPAVVHKLRGRGRQRQ
jgi:hypothetical protein